MQEDVYANSGDMYALVLDAWEEDGSNVSANSCHLAMFPDGVPGKLVMVRARILGDLGALRGPMPNSLDPESGDHQKAIGMQPLFIAKFPDMELPKVGSIVNVDFMDREHFKCPQYTGPAKSSMVNYRHTEGTSASAPFKNFPANKSFSPPPPYEGPITSEGWAFPPGDVPTTAGAEGVHTLAMIGGSPQLRAFMRMITKKEGGAAPKKGTGPDENVIASPYQLVVGGQVVADPQNRARRLQEGKRQRNYFEGYTGGHPEILVAFNKKGGKSTACGRYQYLGGNTWRGFAKRTMSRPGQQERTHQEAINDFSPANQDYATYKFLDGGAARVRAGAGGVPQSMHELLISMGDSPDPNNSSHQQLWKKIMHNKKIGKIWASLPYACYKNQSCVTLEDPATVGRFKYGIALYSALLQEELLIASQQRAIAQAVTEATAWAM